MNQNLEQARTYLARTLPWPQEGEPPAYINLHWTFEPNDVRTDNDGKPIYPWTGRACRNLNEAINALEFALKLPGTRDVYACLSSQREAVEKVGRNNYKYYKAVRNQTNAVALKSLFIDLDFKDYADEAEAVTSLGNFLQKTGLPKPSLMVRSGGGVHVYWTLARAITTAEWLPVAYALAEATKREGLKCDTQCTIDSARVLRVPDTFNRKLDEPRPVKLAGNPPPVDYAIEALADILEPYKVATPAAPEPFADPALFPPKPPITDATDLEAGVEVRGQIPLDFKAVAKECRFIGEAITSGGKDYDNPLWNLTTLAATFFEHGRNLAHGMAYGHPGYTKESTDDLFDRKSREKDEKGLGWPSCATISATGCKACATCPHFSKGKSPLHLGIVRQQAPAMTLTPVPQLPAPMATAAASTNDIPPGYKRRPDGVVCAITQAPDGTMVEEPICSSPMIEPWLQKTPVWELHFTTVTDRRQQVAVPCSCFGAQDMRKILGEQGFVIRSNEVKAVGEFFVSWYETLKKQKNAVVSTSPYGWNVKNGKVDGFVYDARVFDGTGEDRPAPLSDPVIATQYEPVGEPDPWYEAARLITSQGRPALDAILASAFAAPLVQPTGHRGYQISFYSEESGIGKSTALSVAQAVWGDPVRAMQGLTDTTNSVLNKIGTLQSLPLYWDELKTEEDTKRFVNIVFQMTMGKEKSRMTARVQQKAIGSWQTILVSASNESLLDYVVGRTKATTAGLYRVFEVVVPPPVGEVGQIAASDAQRLIAKLNHNYGQVGVKYAEFLGANYPRIYQEVGDYLKELNEEVKAGRDERFWTGILACLLMGARYANELGFVNIDEARLKKFLLGVLEEMRGERTSQPVDMSNPMNVANVLAQYLNAMRARHTLVTNRIHIVQGKPPPGAIKVVTDASRLDAIHVHIGKEDKLLRISSTHLSEWLAGVGYSRHQFTRSLEAQFGVKTVRGRLGSGTDYAGVTEYLLELNLAGSALLNFIDEG